MFDANIGRDFNELCYFVPYLLAFVSFFVVVDAVVFLLIFFLYHLIRS